VLIDLTITNIDCFLKLYNIDAISLPANCCNVTITAPTMPLTLYHLLVVMPAVASFCSLSIYFFTPDAVA